MIFDLDGTLVDTIDDIHESLNCTLKHFGFPPLKLDKTKSYVGDGMRKLVERAVGEVNFDSEIESHFRTTYSENIVNKTKLFDGIPDLLKELRNKQINSVVISNKSSALTEKIIKYFHMDKIINDWYGGDSFKTKKPSPEPVLKALEKYKIEKEHAIMTGDNHTDILSGAAAGIKTCFCSYGYGSTASSKPDYYADKPKELIKIILS
ncbi:HAD family hydrolase [Flexistipes sinusarabici]|uniref:HAD family hydrolase n=1 Tax=Flexistipes sinusarabici TaxID=2352 RepID=UPI0026EE849E|nr:HAD-IA family hydrolase [Flexistipes sinusarabici]